MSSEYREELRKQHLSAIHIKQEEINLITQSSWYKYTLLCGHEVYSKVRIRVPKSYMEHFIRCPQCRKLGETPLNWQAIEKMEAVTDEHVSNVLDGSAFILPKWILRTDGTTRNGDTIGSGNPFPYHSKDAEY